MIKTIFLVLIHQIVINMMMAINVNIKDLKNDDKNFPQSAIGQHFFG